LAGSKDLLSEYLRLGPISRERAQKASERKNRRLAASAPLFAAAGILDEICKLSTPESLITDSEAYFDRLNRLTEMQTRDAQKMRAVVATLVTEDELADLDRRLTQKPKTSEYAADHWWCALKSLDHELAIQWLPENRKSRPRSSEERIQS
jgi:hypothetical protein